MRQISTFIFALFALLLAGCSVTLPLSSMVNEEYIAKPDDYIVIGDVEGYATYSSLFQIIPLSNDAGYLAAYQDALTAAKDMGATNLIEIFSDVHYYSFLGIYTSRTTIVYAKAIKESVPEPTDQ